MPDPLVRLRRLLARARRRGRDEARAAAPSASRRLRERVASLVDSLPADLDVRRVLVLADGLDVQRSVDEIRSRRPDAGVDVLVRADDVRLWTDEAPPGARVHVAASLEDRVALVRTLDRFDLAVDASRRERDAVVHLRRLVFTVRPGGAWAVAGAFDPAARDDRSVAGLLTLAAGLRGGDRATRKAARPADVDLADGIEHVRLDPQGALLRRTGEYYAKLRDWDADAVLDARYGDSWGRVLEVRPATTFTALADVTSHGEGPIASGRRTFAVPPRELRLYRWPRASARQVLLKDDLMLPDSFRHPHQRVLGNKQMSQATADFARYLPRTQPVAQRTLHGRYYYFDSAFPFHFGHITTEVLSRYWGWERARELDGDLVPLVSVRDEGATLPVFQRAIFEALGVDPDAVELVGPREWVDVEELVAATPQFENPHYVDPDLARVWAALSAGLPPVAPPVVAEKIFVSRRPSGKRDCLQAPELEQLFADAGFAVVFPEQYPYAEQRALFAQARVVAGFAGSGMFNMMFAPGARVIVISGDSYTAANEELFAAANANDIHFFWGRSLVPTVGGRYDVKAFKSNWTFDLPRFRDELLELVR
ncbi:glycosyltransferase family 61 protein [Cellulomonas massiliensis]|uniref:glycosyltransferase family 61 protein n=1 Tax=Cellulomonas massiliensis TaxID=1465811 RepID=UPI0002FE8DB8|nr:glycosyltransferase family 61 protein [Cellulomonas massiliensis]